MLYGGAAIIILLAVLMGIIQLLSHGLGFNGIIATFIAGGAIGWLGFKLSTIPRFYPALVEIGWQLIKHGARAFKEFDQIAAHFKNSTTTETAPLEPQQRS